jgi:site-specific recombinase XerD
MQTDTTIKTLSKKIKTRKEGIFYKEIQQITIDDKGNIDTKIIDKVYVVRYRDHENKERLVTIGKYSEGIREAYCIEKRTEFILLAKNGELPPRLKERLKKDYISLDNIFQKYKAIKESESKDIVRTEQKYKAGIKKVFGDMDLHDITTDKIVTYRKTLLDKKRAGSTINSYISFIGTLFNFATEEGLYDGANPIKSKKLKAIKIDNARERYLNIKEIKTLYKAIDNEETFTNSTKEDLTLFVKLSLTTGGRLETILHIQKKDIKLEDGTVTLKDFKTNKTYQGFLSDDLITHLNGYLKCLTTNAYLVGGDTTKKPTRTLTRHLKKVLDDNFNVGLKTNDTKNRTVVHTLRHTFASHLAINGVPIFNIKELMNHSDINMTMRYAKLAPSSGKDAVKGLYR